MTEKTNISIKDKISEKDRVGSKKAWEIRSEKLYKVDSFNKQLRDIKSNYIKFILTPGGKDLVLEENKFELNKLKSKREFVTKFNNPLTKLGIFVILLIVTWAVFVPWISKFNYNQMIGVTSRDELGNIIHDFQAPSAEHWLGTGKFGRDVLGRLIWGARTSLTMGLLAITISAFFGVIVGIISAYYGGIVDNIIMRIVDIIMAFPGLIIIVIAVSILGNEMSNILLLYGLLGIPGYARLIRGSALQEKERTYVESARVSGTPDWRIMFKHILPNCAAPAVIAYTASIGGIILSLAGLAFLGFGDPERLVEWGTDIALNRQNLTFAPWAALVPGIGIFMAVLGFMLLGDGLRDALDPRLQGN